MRDAAVVPRAVSTLVFAIVLIACAYFVQGGGPNESSRYGLTRAIVEDHSLRLDRFHATTFDLATVNFEWFSDKAPGLSLLAAVPYALGARLAQPRASVEPAPFALHLITVATIGLATAAAAVALLHLLVGFGISPRAAVLAVLGWALGTNAFAYATMFYAHQLVAALLVLALAGIRAIARDPSRPRALLFGAGFAAGFAVISEYPAAVLVVGVVAYALHTLGARRTLPFVVGALVPAVILAAYNTACFGSPLRLGYQALADATFANAIASDFLGFTAPRARIVGALLVGEYRGLLPLSPFLILAVPGAVWMIRDRARRALGILCAVACVGFVLLMSGYHFWDGGSAMGPRYLVPVLPFAIVPVAVAIDRLRTLAPRAAWPIAITLVAISIAICTMCVAVGPEFPDAQLTRTPSADLAVPDQQHPLTELVIPLFVHGDLSQKALWHARLTYSGMLHTHDDDTYNLGEAIGLTGLPSLLPLALAWLVCGVLLVRNLRAPAAVSARDVP